MTQPPLLADAQSYLLVKCATGLSPYEVGRIMNALALIRGIECVFDSSVTGLPVERLRVITGEPTAETRRRRVSLAG